jgi:hypothetical protein
LVNDEIVSKSGEALLSHRKGTEVGLTVSRVPVGNRCPTIITVPNPIAQGYMETISMLAIAGFLLDLQLTRFTYSESLAPYCKQASSHIYHSVLVDRFGSTAQRKDKARYTFPPFPEQQFIILSPEPFKKTPLMQSYKLVEPVRLELAKGSVNLL